MIRSCCLVLIAAALLACSDVRVVSPAGPSGSVYVPPYVPPSPYQDLVEYRVVGDLSPVIVRFSNSLDGLSQTTTALPFSAALSIVGRSEIFVSIDARAVTPSSVFTFLHAAIFINGVIFREASATALNPIAAVSGTWRR